MGSSEPRHRTRDKLKFTLVFCNRFAEETSAPGSAVTGPALPLPSPRSPCPPAALRRAQGTHLQSSHDFNISLLSAAAWLAANLRRTSPRRPQSRCCCCCCCCSCRRRLTLLFCLSTSRAASGPLDADRRIPSRAALRCAALLLADLHLHPHCVSSGPVVVFDATGVAIAIGSSSNHMAASLSFDSNEAHPPSLIFTIFSATSEPSLPPSLLPILHTAGAVGNHGWRHYYPILLFNILCTGVCLFNQRGCSRIRAPSDPQQTPCVLSAQRGTAATGLRHRQRGVLLLQGFLRSCY